jgi:hypothetical protein
MSFETGPLKERLPRSENFRMIAEVKGLMVESIRNRGSISLESIAAASQYP